MDSDKESMGSRPSDAIQHARGDVEKPHGCSCLRTQVPTDKGETFAIEFLNSSLKDLARARKIRIAIYLATFVCLMSGLVLYPGTGEEGVCQLQSNAEVKCVCTNRSFLRFSRPKTCGNRVTFFFENVSFTKEDGSRVSCDGEVITEMSCREHIGANSQWENGRPVFKIESNMSTLVNDVQGFDCTRWSRHGDCMHGEYHLNNDLRMLSIFFFVLTPCCVCLDLRFFAISSPEEGDKIRVELQKLELRATKAEIRKSKSRALEDAPSPRTSDLGEQYFDARSDSIVWPDDV